MSLEDIFSKLAVTTVNTVSRIALSHATNAAIRTLTTYATQQTSADAKTSSKELVALQRQLDLKIKNLKPAVDRIAHGVANGNQDLEPALEMCNDLKKDLDSFTEETQRALKNKSDPAGLIMRLKRLLMQVDDTVPSLYLSLRSIEPFSEKVSSSKLVQASSILQQQVSRPVFTVTLYSLFAANIRPAGSLALSSIECTWKEEARKCQLTVEKRSSLDTIGYDLVLKEDINDGLYHDPDEPPNVWRWQVNRFKKMFYTKSGQLLNIEDAKASVLVIKMIKNTPQGDADGKTPPKEEKPASLSPSASPAIKAKQATPNIHRDELDVSEWFALEMWNENLQGSDNSDSDDESQVGDNKREESTTRANSDDNNDSVLKPHLSMNLLLLESVIKLALLEVTEQMCHLNASDELLNMYMS